MTGGMFTVDEARAMGDKVDPEFEPVSPPRPSRFQRS